MFAEAPAPIQLQAGFVSARSRPPSILLKLSLETDTDDLTVIRAIEDNPFVLRHLIRFAGHHDLVRWAKGFARVELESILADICLTQAQNPYDEDLVGHARFMGEIAEALARSMDYEDVRLARLIGLLALMVSPDELQGLSRDAVRFQARESAQIVDAHPLIRITAASRALLEGNIQTGEQVTEIPSAQLVTLLQECREFIPNDWQQIDETRERLEALRLFQIKQVLAAELDPSTIEANITGLGQQLFGLRQARLFRMTENGLQSGALTVRSPQSLLNQSLSQQTMLSRSAAFGSVVDQQLEESAGQRLVVLPLLSDGEPIGAITAGCDELPDGLMMFAEQVARTISSEVRQVDVGRINARAARLIHEVNTPLSTVQNYLKILSLRLGPEHEAQETLTTAANEIIRVGRMVSGFGSITEVDPSISLGSNPARVIQATVSLLRETNPGVQFESSLSLDDIGLEISHDHLVQLISNVANNALEAGATEILIGGIANINFPSMICTELTVQDNGPGIPEALQSNLFQPGVSSKGSTGLGLAVVSDLVNRTGGMVNFKSGHTGTTFQIYLPQLPLEEE